MEGSMVRRFIQSVFQRGVSFFGGCRYRGLIGSVEIFFESGLVLSATIRDIGYTLRIIPILIPTLGSHHLWWLIK